MLFKARVRHLFVFVLLFISLGTLPACAYERVISLAPNITEMIYLLGAEDKLVAVTEACTYPIAAQKKASTGPFGNPSIEKIAALEPDLVLYVDVKDPDFAKKIKTLNIPILQISILNFADLQWQLLKIGALLGKKGKAQGQVNMWQQSLRAAKERSDSKRPIRVYFEFWQDPPISVGGKSFIDEIIKLAGGVNILVSENKSYVKPNEESIIAMDPEVIVIGRMATGNIEFPAYWKNITAVKRGLIVSNIDPDLLLRPGPRVFEGLKRLTLEFDHVRTVLDKKDKK